MATQWTEEKTIEFIKRFLSKDVDETNAKLVKTHRQDLINVANNVRRAIADGKLVQTEILKELLGELEKRQFQLQFGLRFDGVTENPPLLGEKIDTEVMLKVAEACALLGYSVPRGYTGQMFKRWGFMMGMVRQVNAVRKIGTGGFEPLAEIGAVDCSAEYIVYHKALEHGEKVTSHLANGCMEKLEEVLREHKAI